MPPFPISLFFTLPLLFGAGQSSWAQGISPEAALLQAAERSPELREALANLRSAEAGVRIESLSRTPVLQANLQGAYRESFSDTSEGAVMNSSELVGGDIGVSGSTIDGTRLSLGFALNSRWQTINRDPSTTFGVHLGPTTSAELTFDVTQPILRGAGRKVVLASQRAAESQKDQQELLQEQEASQVMLNVLSAYWELWVSEESLSVQEQALELTRRQRDDIEKRIKLGLSPETDYLRMASEVTSREQQLVDSQADLRDKQLQLARLIGEALNEASHLNTDGLPKDYLYERELEDLFRLSEQQSPEILSLDASIEQARQRLYAAQDAESARLDAFLSAGAGGLWTKGGSLTGLELPGDRPAFSVMAGLNFELPLGDSSNTGRLEQSRYQLESRQAARESRIETLRLQIARLSQSLDAAKEATQAAQRTSEIAEKLATLEGKKIQLGTAIITDLISAQQSHREALLLRIRKEAETHTLSLQLAHLTGQLFGHFPLELHP